VNATQRARLTRQRLARQQREKTTKARQRPQLARLARNALNRAKERTGSDLKTAALLGIPPSHLCDFRKGLRRIDPRSAVELANLLNENVMQALGNALAFTARSTSARHFWLDFASGIWPHGRRIYERWADDRFAKEYPIR